MKRKQSPHATGEPEAAAGGGVAARRAPRVLVALWMNGVFGQDVMEGIREWLRDGGRTWVIRFADSESLYSSSIRWMARRHLLDGIISVFWDSKSLQIARRAKIPFVHLEQKGDEKDGPDPAGGRLVSVRMDVHSLATAAVDHLLSRADFRSAGYVENYFDHGWSRNRGDAIVAEFSLRGLRTQRFLHYGRASRTGECNGPDFAGLLDWLRKIEKPAAIVAANDATAADIIHLCASTGISVPRDIAVLGIDDNPVFCWTSDPNLSSIHLDGRKAGCLCAEALLAMMSGREPASGLLRYSNLPIQKRASTAATPSFGDVVQRAVDYIDANACSGASLSDVIRHCGYSRTLVTMRFRQATGKSVEQALRRRRLDEARRLLRDTRLSVEELAPLCGYENASSLRRAFVRETGVTPMAWRNGR
ncbi:MAG: substrate-binding domain-containing protein [Kiritimatiellae bacterium]|nr:substrate-binding domain-containing protein [Kiritimatiellia bacterium]